MPRMHHRAVVAGLSLVLTFGAVAAPQLTVPVEAHADSSSSGLSAVSLSDEMKYFTQFESNCNYDQGFSYGDGYNAMGYYQFDRRYSLGEFITQAYNYNPSKYYMLKDVVARADELKTAAIRKNGSFTEFGRMVENAWHAAYAADPVEFSALQDSYAYSNYYLRVECILRNSYGVEISDRADCVKGLAWSMCNWLGSGGVQQFFRWANEDAGLSDDMTDRELVNALVDAIIDHIEDYSSQSQYYTGWKRRYENERAICLSYIEEDEQEAAAGSGDAGESGTDAGSDAAGDSNADAGSDGSAEDSADSDSGEVDEGGSGVDDVVTGDVEILPTPGEAAGDESTKDEETSSDSAGSTEESSAEDSTAAEEDSKDDAESSVSAGQDGGAGTSSDAGAASDSSADAGESGEDADAAAVEDESEATSENEASDDTASEDEQVDAQSDDGQEETFTVTFTVKGEAIEAVEVEAGKTVSSVEAPSYKGYSFAGWYLNGEPYSFDSVVTNDIELVAFYYEESASADKTKLDKAEIPTSQPEGLPQTGDNGALATMAAAGLALMGASALALGKERRQSQRA